MRKSDLSHYSAKARRTPYDMQKREYGMNHSVEPGRFLLACSGRHPWNYLDAFEGASNDMKAWY
jgi:hypothetical protein